MRAGRYFQSRIRVLGILAALVGVMSASSVMFIAWKYERLVESTRRRGMDELQRFQYVERALADIHLGVIALMGSRPGAADEAALYAESKKVADALDELLATSAALAPIAEDFRGVISRYRADMLLSIEMMTVNGALAERHLARSAVSLSQLNVALSHTFDARRSALDAELARVRERARTEILATIVILALVAIVVVAGTLRLTRVLGLNLRGIEGALVRLSEDHSAVPDLPAGTTGEFREISHILLRFQSAMIERDLNRSQLQAIFESILEAVVVIDERGGHRAGQSHGQQAVRLRARGTGRAQRQRADPTRGRGEPWPVPGEICRGRRARASRRQHSGHGGAAP